MIMAAIVPRVLIVIITRAGQTTPIMATDRIAPVGRIGLTGSIEVFRHFFFGLGYFARV
jgi:hypothetical protein